MAEYEQALSLDPYLVSALLRRAVTRSAAGDHAGALNDCNTAISIDSARADAYSGRGMIYSMKADLPKALAPGINTNSYPPSQRFAFDDFVVRKLIQPSAIP